MDTFSLNPGQFVCPSCGSPAIKATRAEPFGKTGRLCDVTVYCESCKWDDLVAVSSSALAQAVRLLWANRDKITHDFSEQITKKQVIRKLRKELDEHFNLAEDSSHR